ncbi:MAG: TolB family protein, partial [Candidatus Hodarchaeota archaeon]
MRKKYIIIILIISFIFSISYSPIENPYFINTDDNKTRENLQPKSSYGYETRWQYLVTLVSNASNNQEAARLSSDGDEGAIITWHDSRNFVSSKRDIYTQRINSIGELQWTENGTVICNDTNDQWNPEITESGIGGAIITWVDNRGGDEDIYAQKINGSGTLWINNGTIIVNATGDQNSQQICSDENEGAIIVWADNRNGVDYDIYAQRIDKNGNNLWGSNGTVLSNAMGDQESPQIVSDGNGGAIITWVDNRGGDEDIYAQKINGSGTLWINNGTVICNATGDQESPQIVSDGNGGAIITWVDNRSASRGYDIYSQLINLTGYVKWINNGTVICNATGYQKSPQIISDGDGGAIITWVDNRSGNEDIYAQKIIVSGNTAWTNNGTAICNIGTSNQNSTQICSDRRGGAFITWIDYRDAYPSVYVQAVNSSGNRHWVENGSCISKNQYDRFSVQIISDGYRGAIITWVDNRTGLDFNIYAQRFNYLIPPIPTRGYIKSKFSKSLQETVMEFSESFINITIPLIILLCILGLVLISVKIKKSISK